MKPSFDITTFIGRTPMKPKPIIVKHGGPVPVPVPVPVKKTPKVPTVSVSKKGYVKIGTRKCDSYKKSELVSFASTLNVPTENKTIAKICESLKLKYTK